MAKPKKKLTSAQRAAKKQRKKDFMTVFMNGKQVRVRRPTNIDGMDTKEFIRHNADPIWLHRNEEWEILHAREMEEIVWFAGVCLKHRLFVKICTAP